MFAWLTRRVIARLPSRRAAVVLQRVSARGLHFRGGDGKENIVRWDTVQSATAVLSAGVIGGTPMLVLGLAGGGRAVTSSDDPGWAALVETLHLYLAGAERAAVWQLRMLDGRQVEIYRR